MPRLCGTRSSSPSTNGDLRVVVSQVPKLPTASTSTINSFSVVVGMRSHVRTGDCHPGQHWERKGDRWYHVQVPDRIDGKYTAARLANHVTAPPAIAWLANHVTPTCTGFMPATGNSKLGVCQLKCAEHPPKRSLKRPNASTSARLPSRQYPFNRWGRPKTWLFKSVWVF